MPEMNKGEFLAWAVESVKNYLPESYRKAEIDVIPVAKTGVTYTALTVRQKGQTTVPAINLEEMLEAYENNVPLDVIGARMAQIVQSESPVYDTSIFNSYDSIKKNLFIRVCSIDNNKIMLGSVPYKKVENLAITYHIMVNVGQEGMSSATVTKNMLESFNITPEQLHEDAVKNSPEILPVKVESMMNILSGLTDIEMDSMGMPAPPPMVVVTNQFGINGASALFYPGVMDTVAQFSLIKPVPSGFRQILQILRERRYAYDFGERIRFPAFCIHMFQSGIPAHLRVMGMHMPYDFFADGHTVLRQFDCVFRKISERFRSPFFQHRKVRIYGTGNRNGMDPVVRHTCQSRLSVVFRKSGFRRAARTVEGIDLFLPRDIDKRERVSSQAAHIRQDSAGSQRHGDCRVDCVSASVQHPESGSGDQCVGRSRHSLPSGYDTAVF